MTLFILGSFYVTMVRPRSDARALLGARLRRAFEALL